MQPEYPRRRSCFVRNRGYENTHCKVLSLALSPHPQCVCCSCKLCAQLLQPTRTSSRSGRIRNLNSSALKYARVKDRLLRGNEVLKCPEVLLTAEPWQSRYGSVVRDLTRGVFEHFVAVVKSRCKVSKGSCRLCAARVICSLLRSSGSGQRSGLEGQPCSAPRRLGR